MITGGWRGGQQIATSLYLPGRPVPVLSPARQPFGRPARMRFTPVFVAIIHSMSNAREAVARTGPVKIFSTNVATA